MWLLCPAIFHVSVFIFFLGGIFRQFGGIFYNVGHKLLEVKRILFCDNGLAGFRFKCLPRNAGHLAAAFGNLLVFFKGLRLCSLGNIRGGGLGQHSQHKFQIGHVVPEIFFCQTFQPLVLPRGHAGPCAGDFIGQDGVLLALLHSALLPFVR